MLISTHYLTHLILFYIISLLEVFYNQHTIVTRFLNVLYKSEPKDDRMPTDEICYIDSTVEILTAQLQETFARASAFGRRYISHR